eukprot:jgi/Undpi1/1833/HiC_scaffold_12.g05220.m1
MMSILSGDELLWSEFEAGLDVLVEATRAADRSYVEGRGMSLASIAVGSAATRLSKVQAATESRDLRKTKAAVDKAIPKIREAAFTSSGDPENAALEGNLATLSALLAVLKQIEEAVGEAGEPGNTGSNSGNSVAAADEREDKNGGTNEQQISDPTQVRETRQEQAQESRGKNANQEASQEVTKLEVSQDDGALLKTVGALGGDLGVVEPDDDPLSCLADEEGDAGGGNGGRPPMRLLVAPVDPKLAEKEGKLYWGKKAWARDSSLRFAEAADCDAMHQRVVRSAAASKYAVASRSLIGEGRQYIRELNEALLALIEGCAKKNQPTENLAGTGTAVAAENNSFGNETVKNGKPTEAGATMEAGGVQEDKVSSPPSLDLVETLRLHVWQGSKEALWPRLSLAYALEEQGDSFEERGEFSASCAVYSEASALFESCAAIFPSQPEYLLRQWVTARRALEAGSVGPKPDMKALRRCVKLCKRGAREDGKESAEDQHVSSSCGSGRVCYEAHLELAGALLELGQFERCTEVCGHVLAEHDTDDDEALYSMAEALEALGRSQESMEYAERATPLPLDAE